MFLVFRIFVVFGVGLAFVLLSPLAGAKLSGDALQEFLCFPFVFPKLWAEIPSTLLREIRHLRRGEIGKKQNKEQTLPHWGNPASLVSKKTSRRPKTWLLTNNDEGVVPVAITTHC
jgi:hypothetical protein